VWKGTAVEMLNVVAYAKDRAAEQERQNEQWRKSH